MPGDLAGAPGVYWILDKRKLTAVRLTVVDNLLSRDGIRRCLPRVEPLTYVSSYKSSRNLLWE